MAKLYKFNMERNGHNIDTARVILRNRWYDAVDAGDHEAAHRLQDRIDRIDGITGGCLSGMLRLPYEEWEFLHTVSEWVKHWRGCMCEAAGVAYVE